MTNAEKIVLVKATTEETDETVISAFLAMAGDAIVHYCDPYGTQDAEELLTRYGGVQVRVTAMWLNKRGADGQLSHTENGTSRTYESADIPPSFLRELTPWCGGFNNENS